MAKFTATLVKWGNSVGVSIPKPIRDSWDIDAGDEVEMVDKEDGSIIITPKKKQNNGKKERTTSSSSSSTTAINKKKTISSAAAPI